MFFKIFGAHLYPASPPLKDTYLSQRIPLIKIKQTNNPELFFDYRDRPAELELLRQANIFVKDILKDINARVAEKERRQRLFEIYNKIGKDIL